MVFLRGFTFIRRYIHIILLFAFILIFLSWTRKGKKKKKRKKFFEFHFDIKVLVHYQKNIEILADKKKKMRNLNFYFTL